MRNSLHLINNNEVIDANCMLSKRNYNKFLNDVAHRKKYRDASGIYTIDVYASSRVYTSWSLDIRLCFLITIVSWGK